jgi:AraC family transcriptional regulator of adaptative response/methylated-DNA-[protein]-cysteine methyltransferase
MAKGDSSKDLMVALSAFIRAHAHETLSLSRLAKEALMSPTHLQKRFKAFFGVSPKAYQDAVRLGRFKGELRAGRGVLESIDAAGFGSTSRVYDRAMRNLGMTPSAYRAGGAGETISYACRKTALGSILMAATDRGVCFVQFGPGEGALVTQLRGEFPRATVVPSKMQASAALDDWLTALEAHLAGQAPHPDLPLDLRGTAFQIKVWQFLLSIPEGSAMSYGEVARSIGAPKATRAVASACAANRVAVLVPCHRVLRADGGLGGYRWGLARKRALLRAEHRADDRARLA